MEKNTYSQFIATIVSSVENGLSENFVSFVEQFYATLPTEKYAEVKLFSEIANEAYSFLKERLPHQRKIEIFTLSKVPDILQKDRVAIFILNPDIPFLVDSFTEEIKANGFTVYRRLNVVLSVERNQDGKLTKIHKKESPANFGNESFIYFLVSSASPEKISELQKKLEDVSRLVANVVADWGRMLTVLENEIQRIDSSDPVKQKNPSCSLSDEVTAFLKWLNDDNFIFLGYDEYRLVGKKLEKEPTFSLGISKFETELGGDDKFREYKGVLHIGRSRYVSRVHRRVNADCVRIKCLSENGEVIGEKRFLGLFTSLAHYRDVRLIPILRRKIENIERMSGFVKGGHNHKSLLALMQGMSKGELFQTSSEELHKICKGMISLAVKPSLRVFIRRDEVGMFIYCVVFVPNAQFSMKLRYKIRDFLTKTFNGTLADEYVVIGESGLVRLQFVLNVGSFVSSCTDEEIEERLTLMAKDWEDELGELITDSVLEKEEKLKYREYVGKFPESYKESFDVASAYADIGKICNVTREKLIEVKLYEEGKHRYLKIYFPEGKLELYQLILVIENMAMEVVEHNCYRIKCTPRVMMHHFLLKSGDEMLFPLSQIKDKFEDSLLRILNEQLENDGYNALVVLAGLSWREVVLLRVFAGYLKQVSFKYNPAYIQAALSHVPEAAVLIIKMFHMRFSQEIDDAVRNEEIKMLKAKLEELLSSVTNIIYDNIIRALAGLCFAILRTNYYMNKEYISIKVSSKEVSDMPLPKPFVEIFVYHSQFEAIHLRGGKVARGGIRWSDRIQDFRVEILGLMKAQMAKNTAIIPVGSKGGFVIKKSIEDRKLMAEMAVRYYQDFLRGLLDLTDNIVDGKCQKVKDIIAYDGDDCYLVVAADKGTANFSNYANDVSAEYSFWLGDAFASGGSHGYDHKKLGITARGAWISLEMAFWEKFGELKKKEFTVVGIGDMSGDVFGNGMLLSDELKLVAAFNHVHIFVDPNPVNPKASFEERKRLFNMPTSTWEDYNPSLISRGGGVFLRSEKSIRISSEMKEFFEISEDVLTPDELIRYILQADVDVIWNGGVGTYVKSSQESNDVVGDKSNDNVRVDGKNIRASIFIEGGNLGCTQFGRIEYAANGGIINTDFIDNCAGVSCSDMEVNIKIALSSAVKSKKITLEERDTVLVAIEPEVVKLILLNINRVQSLMMAMEIMRSGRQLEQYQNLLNKLVKVGLLDRKVEFLPSDDEIKRLFAEGKSFERPQLAVLSAYSKMYIYEKIITSNLPDEKILNRYLIGYFPTLMRERFMDEILNHPLRREIIATKLANDIINRFGCTFVQNIVQNTGFSSKEVIYVLVAVMEIYELSPIFDELENFIGKVDIHSFHGIDSIFVQFLNRSVHWLLKNCPNPINIISIVEDFSQEIREITQRLVEILDAASLKKYQDSLCAFEAIGLPTELSAKLASLGFIEAALGIVQTRKIILENDDHKIDCLTVGRIYFNIGAALSLSSLREMACEKFENGSYWQRMSVYCLLDELCKEQFAFTREIAKYVTEDVDYSASVEEWSSQYSAKLERYKSFYNEVASSGELDMNKFMVLVKRLRSMLLKEY
ncbi:NAD-glutamate dehydrogenase [Neorickettsia sp. 179522]|uniref:NAD-glutamate dehydrogenase n=1 Tax=Neorickettsia sp. 179522 TaxID=1714371 RepID=UPI000600F57C|nr:NAD-glutamate dehydrogenase domain-containing protein [Neorickettsia sp. 179522]KYH12566.1 NAD-glutamate dehydrogenase [Neorickettsia sp. 179522]